MEKRGEVTLVYRSGFMKAYRNRNVELDFDTFEAYIESLANLSPYWIHAYSRDDEAGCFTIFLRVARRFHEQALQEGQRCYIDIYKDGEFHAYGPRFTLMAAIAALRGLILPL